MKKVIFVMVLFMSTLIVSAQQDTCKTTKSKAATTTMSNDKAIRTAVKLSDLQKVITDNVSKDYAGFTIKEATSVSLESVITYEVVIVKGMTSETLVYDKDGNFVQKLAMNDTMNQLRK